MFNELDTVVLADNMPEAGLERGDIGTIVHVYTSAAAYEVEFVTGKGETIALLTLAAEKLRPMREREILHARTLLPA